MFITYSEWRKDELPDCFLRSGVENPRDAAGVPHCPTPGGVIDIDISTHVSRLGAHDDTSKHGDA